MFDTLELSLRNLNLKRTSFKNYGKNQALILGNSKEHLKKK